jgi:hypothetical protein
LFLRWVLTHHHIPRIKLSPQYTTALAARILDRVCLLLYA